MAKLSVNAMTRRGWVYNRVPEQDLLLALIVGMFSSHADLHGDQRTGGVQMNIESLNSELVMRHPVIANINASIELLVHISLVQALFNVLVMFSQTIVAPRCWFH